MVDVHPSASAPIWPDSIKDHWTLFLVEGIILVILGMAAILVPAVASLAVALFLGWLFLIGGIVGAVTTMARRRSAGIRFTRAPGPRRMVMPAPVNYPVQVPARLARRQVRADAVVQAVEPEPAAQFRGAARVRIHRTSTGGTVMSMG